MKTLEKPMFETLLASSVHDMKNSLGLLLSEIEKISELVEKLTPEEQKGIADIQYQAGRINVSLMELLSLYKLENKQIYVQYSEAVVIDVIEDVIAAFSRLADARGIRIDLDCDDVLIWFFDLDLMGIVLNNIVGNCLRYSSSRILIRAVHKNDRLVFSIEDDGQGYPDSMLGDGQEFKGRVDHISGSTGMGLYFAQTIASQHKRSDSQGYISLSNGGELGGGRFEVSLP